MIWTEWFKAIFRLNINSEINTAVLSEKVRGSSHRSESGRVWNLATTPPWLPVVFSILFDIYKQLILLFTTFAPVSWRQCPHCTHDILSKFAAWVLIRLVSNEINWKQKITAVLSERVRSTDLNPAECEILPLRHPDCLLFSVSCLIFINNRFCCSLK